MLSQLSFVIIIICIALCFQTLKPVTAYTYFTQWWLGYSETSGPEDSAGLLNIYYTYPNRVFAGQNFSVGITFST
jgi:hypothetical protein